MKRLLLSCLAILTLSFSCSAAMADVKEHYCHVFPPSHAVDLRNFNISSEVNALRRTKDKCDKEFMGSDHSKEAYAAAYKPYEDEKVKQFKNAWNRLRDHHAKSRVTVTKQVQLVAVPPHDYGKRKGLDLRAPFDGCTVRIDCPYPGLKPSSTGCYAELCRCNPSGKGDFYVAFDKIENNGYTYKMQVIGKDNWFVCKFQADFAYTDAYLNALADRDLQVLKDRIMQAL